MSLLESIAAVRNAPKRQRALLLGRIEREWRARRKGVAESILDDQWRSILKAAVDEAR
jgi:hypothetical protein